MSNLIPLFLETQRRFKIYSNIKKKSKLRMPYVAFLRYDPQLNTYHRDFITRSPLEFLSKHRVYCSWKSFAEPDTILESRIISHRGYDQKTYFQVTQKSHRRHPFPHLRKITAHDAFRLASTVYIRSRKIPAHIAYIVWHRDQHRCVRCGSQEDLQLDHLIPYSKGGATSIENLQVLCRKCNIQKFNRIAHPSDILMFEETAPDQMEALDRLTDEQIGAELRRLREENARLKTDYITSS